MNTENGEGQQTPEGEEIEDLVFVPVNEDGIEMTEETADLCTPTAAEALEKELAGERDKYVRLYAEFENYKKRVARDRTDLIRYGNESLLHEVLPSVDHLETALKHAGADAPKGLLDGVSMTLREMLRTLEKFGLTAIEAEGKPFNPEVHHAMSRVERIDMDENMVVEEFRKGYMYRDKVLRPAMVSVSARPSA